MTRPSTRPVPLGIAVLPRTGEGSPLTMMF
jgi:hypothetical protein